MNSVLILFLNLFKVGGLEAYNQHLCAALTRTFPEINFDALSLYDSQPIDQPAWSNFNFFPCGFAGGRIFQQIIFLSVLAGRLVRKRPTCIVCTHVNFAVPVLVVHYFFRIPFVVLAYGVDVWSLTKGVKYAALQKADKILTISDYTRARLVSQGIDARKITIIHNPIDTSRFHPKPPQPGLRASLGIGRECILLTVGRLAARERYKGHDRMIEVLKELGPGYVWLVVGDGDDRPRLMRKASESGCGERVRFLGRVSEEALIEYYNLCDIFVMPSAGEGFGVVFLEALACGKPSIGGDRDGSRDALLPFRSGFTVDPFDTAAIAAAIKTLRSGVGSHEDAWTMHRLTEEHFGIRVFQKRVKDFFSPLFAPVMIHE